jgi:sarcosine oxidase subunit beta
MDEEKLDHTFDVIVVGAGYIGSSVAYHLCSAGLKTALFDQGSMAAGASRANYGNIQIQDMELSRSVEMITQGRQRFADLEQELDWNVGLRKIGGLLPIENENQWKILEKRMQAVNAAGIPSELITSDRLKEVEPLIDSKGLLGGLYHPNEGQVDPFRLIWGYLLRARQRGLKEFYYHKLIGFTVENGRLVGIETPQGKYSAGCIVLCTGANTRQLGQMLGRTWNSHYVLGQAMVTESIGMALQNHIASASFFEEGADVPKGTLLANMAMGQSGHGHLLLGEAMYEADHFKRNIPPQSLPAISNCVLRFFPSFHKLRILRSWSAPIADTLDGCPLFGPVESLPGLFIATAFRSTVIITPLVGELMTQLVTQGKCALDIQHFSPERNTSYAN